MHSPKYPSSNYARILFRHLRLSEENHQGYFAWHEGVLRRVNVLGWHDFSQRPHANLSQRPCHFWQRRTWFVRRRAAASSAHGPLGVATSSGPDLRTAPLHLLAKYGLTRTDFFDITLSQHRDGLKVSFTETFDLAEPKFL